MRHVENRDLVTDNTPSLNDIIDPILTELESNPNKNKKKILEVCHTGKFLMLAGGGLKIERVLEMPDFIIRSGNSLIGLEHQIVIDAVSKEKEGFIENIFDIAESELATEVGLPNFLANCWLHHDLDFKLADKRMLVDEVKRVVKEFIWNGSIPSNVLINDMSLQRHSMKSLSPNMGAWWQKRITAEIIEDSVSRKESKIESYVRNTKLDEQWLLLVIGSVKNSSYEIDSDISVNIKTKFNKVFLMEDFRARLFEIK
jgi:hypothetical protein